MRKKVYDKLLEWKNLSQGSSAMLVAGDHKLFLYSRYDEKNAENRMEIDFLIQKPTITARHNISPIK